MSEQRNDHYVPQFILRRFLPKGKGRRKERLFYAEKATPGMLFEGVMLPNTPNTSSASRGTK